MANFQITIGANYAELNKDLQLATDKMTAWNSKNRKNAILNIVAKLDNKNLQKQIAQTEALISSAERKNGKRVFSLFTATRGQWTRNVDFSSGVKSLAQLESRIKEINTLINQVNAGKYRIAKGLSSQGNTLSASDAKALTYLQKLQKGYGDLKAQIVATNNEMYKGVRGLERQGNILQRIIGFAKAYFNIFMASNLVKRIAETTGYFERQQAALSAIIQDGAKATSLFNQLRDYSVKTPLTLKDLVDYTKKLTAYQIPTDELFETTKRLSDLSVGLGVDMNRIVLAFGQIRAASVLRGQEVRQLTEAGIPIINELAKSFELLEGRAVSTGEVFKKISERGVPFEMVRDILWDMTDAGGKFYNMQEKIMNTDVYGPMMKIKDKWTIAMNEIGTQINGPIKFGLNAILKIIENWKVSLSAILGILGSGIYFSIAKIVKTFSATVNWLGLVITAVTTIAGVVWNAVSSARAFEKATKNVSEEYATKANKLVGTFKQLSEELNNCAEGSKKEEEIMRKLHSAFADILPQQDLTVKRLRNMTDGYKELTAAIIANVEAEKNAALREQYNNTLSSKVESKIQKKFGARYNQDEGAFKQWLTSYITQKFTNDYTPDIDYEVIKTRFKNSFGENYDYKTFSNDLLNILGELVPDNNKMLDSLNKIIESSRYDIVATTIGIEQMDNISEYNSKINQVINEENKLAKMIEENGTNWRGQKLENKNNFDILNSIEERLKIFGLIDSESQELYQLYTDIRNGNAGGRDIVSFLSKLKTGDKYKNAKTYERNYFDMLESETISRFPLLSKLGDKANNYIDDYVKNNPMAGEMIGKKMKYGQQLDEFQSAIVDAYENVTKKISEFKIKDPLLIDDEDLKEQLKRLLILKNGYQEVLDIINMAADDKSMKDKKDEEKKEKNIKIQRAKALESQLENAFNMERKMMDWESEDLVVNALYGLNQKGLSEFFAPEKRLASGSINWYGQIIDIVNELKSLDDSDAAEIISSKWEKRLAKTQLPQEINRVRDSVNYLNREFGNTNSAQEYFKTLIDAGMSWKDALSATENILGSFNITIKGTELIKQQIAKLIQVSGIKGIQYDLNTNLGLREFEDLLKYQVEQQIGPEEDYYSIAKNMFPREIAQSILELLQKLRELEQNELVELVKINTDNYDNKGIRSERSRLWDEYQIALLSGSSSQIMDSYGRLSANNARLFNPFNTGNDASFALSNLYELIKKGENVQENTSAFNKIAETLPGGNRVKEALATNDGKIIEDAIKKATAKLKLQEIAGKMDDMLSVFNSAVSLVDSFTLITGGQVNENDQFHTAMSSFTTIMSSGASAVKKALTGDFLGAIADGAKAMSELVLFGAKIHDAGLQQEIDKLTEHIEKLDTAISNLERTASLSYGEEKWLYESNALRKMYVQLEDAKKASELENSKKIIDKDKRAELEQNVTDMELSIEEKWKEITDDIFGSVDDIASRLGNALRDAFENGKNAARAWKDAVNEYVKDIFYNLMIESVMKDKVDEIVQGWKAKSQTDTDTKNEEKRAELIQEEYQKYLDKVDKYSKEHEGNNQMIHGYAMEQYKEYQDKVDEINATSYYSEKDAFKDWVLKNTDKMAEDLNDIYNDPELQAYYKVWKNLPGSTSSSTSSNSLQSMTEDTANRLLALWNTNLSYVLNINYNVAQIYSNTSGIKSIIEQWKSTNDAFIKNVENYQKDILSYFNKWSNGNQKIYVIQN